MLLILGRAQSHARAGKHPSCAGLSASLPAASPAVVSAVVPATAAPLPYQTFTVCARCGSRGSRWLRPFRHSRSAARLLLGFRLRGAAVPPPARGLAPPVAIAAAGKARHAGDG
eukprot:scaffold103185_cov63-Phaeocystis_antarctica.AAC.5